MSPLMIAVRAAFAYVFLLILLRVSGKRTIRQGTPLDFVVALILGDMIDDLLWAEVPASVFVVGTGTLMLVHLIVSVGAFKSPAFARLVDGTPCVILRDGSLDQQAIDRERISEGDVMADMRLGSVEDLRELQEARIEVSGLPSIQKREWAKEAQNQDKDRLREILP
jgi:uncharacterized membrane protein YcaP (DUF421 family)